MVRTIPRKLALGCGFAILSLSAMVVQAAAVLEVTPAQGWTTYGPQGGPFPSTSKIYQLKNTGDEALDWTAATAAGWLSTAPQSGQLDADATVQVTVSLTAQADALAVGQHASDVEFVNSTNHDGDASRTVTLTVADAMFTASRTSGTAPLAVFFDAVTTAGNVLQPADADYAIQHYQWRFGDDPALTFATDGASKNEAVGYVAAHVYEEPGTYPVLLTVTDESGVDHYYYQSITVSAFSGTTFYVSSSSGSDSNAGMVEAQPIRSYSKAMSLVGDGRRILFKRGDRWTIGHGARISAEGPGIIGAYATGDKPIIEVKGPAAALELACDDWRVMDLVLKGPLSGSKSAGVEGVGLTRNLLLRVEVEGFRVGIEHGWEKALLHANNCIADCVVTRSQINGVYVGGRNLAILGCRFEQPSVSHVLRIWHMLKGVVGHCRLLDPGGDRLALKLHNESELSVPESRYIVISDNQLRGHVYGVSIAPQNATSDERVADVIFERNVLTALNDTQRSLLVAALRVTVRNNVFDGSGGSPYYTGMDMNPFPAGGTTGHRIYNNTIYRGGSGQEFTGVLIAEDCVGVTVRNNLASAPQISGGVMIGGGGSQLTADHNLLTDDPGFIDAAGGDFSLATDSPGVDAGVAVPYVRNAINEKKRPLGNGYDLGAYER